MKHHRVVHEGTQLSPYTYLSVPSRGPHSLGSSIDEPDSPVQPTQRDDSDTMGSPQTDHDVFHGSLIEAIYQQRMLAVGRESQSASSESGMFPVDRSASTSLPLHRNHYSGYPLEMSGDLSVRSDATTLTVTAAADTAAAARAPTAVSHSNAQPGEGPVAPFALEEEVEAEERKLEALASKLLQRNAALSYATNITSADDNGAAAPDVSPPVSREEEVQYQQTRDAMLKEQQRRQIDKERREQLEQLRRAQQRDRAQMEDYIRREVILEAMVECGLVAHEAAVAAMEAAALQAMIDDDADRRHLARLEAERLSRQKREDLERAYYECQDPLLRSLREAGQSRRALEAAAIAAQEEAELHDLEARVIHLAQGSRGTTGGGAASEHATEPLASTSQMQVPYWKKRPLHGDESRMVTTNFDLAGSPATWTSIHTKHSPQSAGLRVLTAAQAVAAVESWEVPQLLSVIENAADAADDVPMRGLSALLMGISGV